MNYYIDFDNTLYETAKLTETMLNEISEKVEIETNLNKEDIFKYVKENFDSSNDNIYTYAEKVGENFNVNKVELVNCVKDVVEKGKIFVFKDAESFLKKLKETDNKIILLTFMPKSNQEYQLQKIYGSGLAKYFDTLIITSDMKFNLDLDYKNGIFIDDNPRDLEGLHSKNPIRLIRIRKPNNKRYEIEMNISGMEEYKSFDDIKI